MAGLRHGQVGPPLVDNIGEKYRVICAVNDDLFTEKIKTPTTKLAPRTAGADDPMWLARASPYPASVLRFHRTSQAAARSGDARPAARRAPRRNAIGGLTADHRVVFGRLHDRPIRMARQAAAPGEIAAARPSRERGSARSAAPACRRAVRAESRGCGSPQCARQGHLGNAGIDPMSATEAV
jgi:hypothetical protein